jgi:hypothetical protein
LSVVNCVIDTGILADRRSLYSVVYTYDACISIIRTARGVPVRKGKAVVGKIVDARMSDPEGMMPGHIILELALRLTHQPGGYDYLFADPLTIKDAHDRVVSARLSSVVITR